MKIIPLLPLVLFSASILQAAPSTDLGAEIHVPLESSSAFALVHKSTGDVRLVIPGGGGNGDYTSVTYPSGLTGITGATSGFNDGTNEFLMLASPTDNRLSRFNVSSGVSTPLFTEFPAPQFPAFVSKDPTVIQRLFLTHTSNGEAPALAAYAEPLGDLAFKDANPISAPITSFLPFYEGATDPRYAAGILSSPTKSVIFVYTNDSLIDIDILGNTPNGLLLTTNVESTGGDLMLVGHVPGNDMVYLFSMPSPPSVFDADAVQVPFNIGSIAPAPRGIGPAGILITSADGSRAYHYAVVDVDKLTLIQEFKAADASMIHGLVPVPGHGLMLLSGNDASDIDRFNRMTWNGNDWDVDQSEFLSGIGAVASPDFATMFWFDSEPMVNTSARLLKLEVNPDWTSKQSPAPIPSKIFAESFLSSSTGLGNPILFAPSPPSGAAFLMTNQWMDSVSLSAMDSTLALRIPPLQVDPASGTYTTPVQLTASSSEDEFTIFYRNATEGGNWRKYDSPLSVAYSSTWQFYAIKPNGDSSPILSRQLTFDVNNLTRLDSDGDSVPDFVERANGLNPNGGVDTDADGYSDLDELINGSNPNNASSTPASASSPFNGQGFRLFVQAQNYSGGPASDGDPTLPPSPSDGVPVDLMGMTSNLLASSPTELLTAPSAPAPLVGQLAASFQVKTPVPTREWIMLNTPQYFDANGSNPEVRSGREIYKIIQRPVQNPPSITPTLTGNDIDADAAAWVAAAATAYGTYSQVPSLTTLKPSDTAAAVLTEAAIYNALRNLTPAIQTSLNVPQDAAPIFGYDRFTLFGNRSTDTRRTSLSTDMRDALLYDGLSFKNLLFGIRGSLAASTNLPALCDELYIFHVNHSAPTASPSTNIIPLLPLPLDVLRTLARGGDLPADYNPATTPGRVTAAKVEMATALAGLASAYRPVGSWTIEVIAPTSADEKYSYRKLSDAHTVAFYQPDGDRYSLDQGMGLAIGTRFSVTGYTDVPSPTGYDGMELLSLNVLFIPLASDNDADANLLADDWEKFFFGATGAVDPFAKHPVNGYTYLQLYLLGADPRDDAAPSEPIAILFPGATTTVQLPSGNFALEFTFPDAYVDHFEFVVQESGALNAFGDLPAASSVSNLGGNLHQIDVGAIASGGAKNFFRLYLRLKND